MHGNPVEGRLVLDLGAHDPCIDVLQASDLVTL